MRIEKKVLAHLVTYYAKQPEFSRKLDIERDCKTVAKATDALHSIYMCVEKLTVEQRQWWKEFDPTEDPLDPIMEPIFLTDRQKVANVETLTDQVSVMSLGTTESETEGEASTPDEPFDTGNTPDEFIEKLRACRKFLLRASSSKFLIDRDEVIDLFDTLITEERLTPPLRRFRKLVLTETNEPIYYRNASSMTNRVTHLLDKIIGSVVRTGRNRARITSELD